MLVNNVASPAAILVDLPSGVVLPLSLSSRLAMDEVGESGGATDALLEAALLRVRMMNSRAGGVAEFVRNFSLIFIPIGN